MVLKNVNFVLSKIKELTDAVKRLERLDRELSVLGLGDSLSEYGVSFEDKTIIFEDGTKEKVDEKVLATLRGGQSARQKCKNMAKAIVRLCKQGDIQTMSEETELSRLYGRQSFLYQIVADTHKLEKFKRELQRAGEKQDNEALVALVKILKKIGY